MGESTNKFFEIYIMVRLDGYIGCDLSSSAFDALWNDKFSWELVIDAYN